MEKQQEPQTEEIKNLEINFQSINLNESREDDRHVDDQQYLDDQQYQYSDVQQQYADDQQPTNYDDYLQQMYYQQYMQQQMYSQQCMDMSLMYYNPIENYLNCINHPDIYIQNDQNALFFMMKSFNEANILYAIQNGIWCSTFKGNLKLDQFFQSYPFTPIYLFFSINESGSCQGMAQMKSNVNFSIRFPVQNQQNKWKGIFTIEWLFIKTISNEHFRKIKNRQFTIKMVVATKGNRSPIVETVNRYHSKQGTERNRYSGTPKHRILF